MRGSGREYNYGVMWSNNHITPVIIFGRTALPLSWHCLIMWYTAIVRGSWKAVGALRWPTWNPPCCWWLSRLSSTLQMSPQQLSPFAEMCCLGRWSQGTPRCRRCPCQCWRGWLHWKEGRIEIGSFGWPVRHVKVEDGNLDLGLDTNLWIKIRVICLIFELGLDSSCSGSDSEEQCQEFVSSEGLSSVEA